MSNNSSNAYVEAKIEYTKQLQSILTPRLYEGMESIFTDASKASTNVNELLRVFHLLALTNI